jgi:hypothetical protein
VLNKTTRAMKNIGINDPCSENWNEMNPTQKGAFCQKCATEVHDFTNKSNYEIKQTLKSLIGQPVCGRITNTQEAALNAEFEAWQIGSKRTIQSAMLFSLIVVFGLTLFSCSNEKEKETIQQIQHSAMRIFSDNTSLDQTVKANSESIEFAIPEIMVTEMSDILGKISYEQPIQDIDMVDIVESRHYSYAGGMGYSTIYMDYLEQTVVTDPFLEIEKDENGIAFPTEFTSKVFPNPVSTLATLEVGIPTKERFEITLFDMNGKLVESIYSGNLDRGTFRYQIDMTNLITGMYIVVIASENSKESLRISKL